MSLTPEERAELDALDAELGPIASDAPSREPVGKLDAALQGFKQFATGKFADETAGMGAAYGTFAQTLADEPWDGYALNKAIGRGAAAYNTGRKEDQQHADDAYEDQPGSYVAGGVGGTLLSAPLLKGKGVAGGAATGAGVGGVFGMGGSEATDAGGLTLDTLTGAGLGAAGGALFGAAAPHLTRAARGLANKAQDSLRASWGEGGAAAADASVPVLERAGNAAGGALAKGSLGRDVLDLVGGDRVKPAIRLLDRLRGAKPPVAGPANAAKPTLDVPEPVLVPREAPVAAPDALASPVPEMDEAAVMAAGVDPKRPEQVAAAALERQRLAESPVQGGWSMTPDDLRETGGLMPSGQGRPSARRRYAPGPTTTASEAPSGMTMADDAMALTPADPPRAPVVIDDAMTLVDAVPPAMPAPVDDAVTSVDLNLEALAPKLDTPPPIVPDAAPVDPMQAVAARARQRGIDQRFSVAEDGKPAGWRERAQLQALGSQAERQAFFDDLAQMHGRLQTAPLAEEFALTMPASAPKRSTQPGWMRAASSTGAHTGRQEATGTPWRDEGGIGPMLRQATEDARAPVADDAAQGLALEAQGAAMSKPGQAFDAQSGQPLPKYKPQSEAERAELMALPRDMFDAVVDGKMTLEQARAGGAAPKKTLDMRPEMAGGEFPVDQGIESRIAMDRASDPIERMEAAAGDFAVPIPESYRDMQSAWGSGLESTQRRIKIFLGEKMDPTRIASIVGVPIEQVNAVKAGSRLVAGPPLAPPPKNPFKWHTTSAESMDDIATRGLDPGRGGSTMSNYSSNSRGRVFGADSPDSASSWASKVRDHLQHASDDEVSPVMLRIKGGKWSPDEVGSRDVLGGSSFTKSSVPPKNLEFWDGSRWRPVSEWDGKGAVPDRGSDAFKPPTQKKPK